MDSLDFSTKKYLMDIARNCFWYKKNYYAFLDSCKIPRTFYAHLGDDVYKQEKMRIILESIERQEKWDLLNNIVSNIYKLRLSDNDGLKDIKRANLLLEEFKSYVGNDPIEMEIEKRKAKVIQDEYLLSIEQSKLKSNKRYALKQVFFDIQKNIGTQKAGYDFEKLFFDLLEIEGFEYSPPYRHLHEQIDGSLKYNKFDYLIEVKATTDQVGQNEFSIFDGKIRGKGQSTRGLFISITGFNPVGISKFSGDSPRIICIDGSEIYQCLDDFRDFSDIMKNKEDAFVRKGEIYSKL